MASATEERFKLSDGKELYTKRWHPSGSPTAKLIFVHGFSDHCNRYYELFPTLAERGILVCGFDQRGFGQSVKKPSEKGLTGPTSQVLTDLVEIIKAELPSPIPVFVMGHSMGGGVVLTLASTPEYKDLIPQIRGWLLESPYIALSFKPNPITVFAGRFAGKALPHFQIKQPIVAKDLSRDPLVIKSVEEDTMCDGTGTLQFFAAMLDRAAALDEGRTKLDKGVKSLWLAHGTSDLAVSYAASQKWFDRQKTLEDKTFKTYEGWYHVLHSDLPETRPIFAKDVGDWILSKLRGEEIKATESETVTKPAKTTEEAAQVETSAPAVVEEQARL